MEQVESEDCLGDEMVPFLGGEFGVARGESSAKVIIECVNRTFGSVAAMCVWGDQLEGNIVFVEGFLHGTGEFFVEDAESGSSTVLLEMFVAHFPGFGDLQGFSVLQKLYVDGVGVVVAEDEYILVSAGREYRELACLIQI